MTMDLLRWVLFLSYILTALSGCLTNAQPLFTYVYCYYHSRDTYTNDSTFKKNLDALASIVSSSKVSFHNLSIGQNPDRVNVIALCRGDVAWNKCHSCLIDAYTKLREICPNDKQPIGWYDDCMLRYSDSYIFNTMFTHPYANISNPATVSNGITRQFNQAVTTLLSELLGKASSGTSFDKKFATGKIRIGPDNNRTTIYALAECTPDLSVQECRDCLNHTRGKLPECCDGRIGGRVLYPSCNFRYEISPFYSATTSDGGRPTVLPSSIQGNGNGENKRTRKLIIIVTSTIIFLVLVIACIWIIMRKIPECCDGRIGGRVLYPSSIGHFYRATDETTSVDGAPTTQQTIDATLPQPPVIASLEINFDTIKVATDNFSDNNKLGQGGFGAVYKGTLPNGQVVSVKRLSQDSNQGDGEFIKEVLIIANLRHRNLVSLLGYCVQETEKLVIYEFIHNASLDHFIFDSEKCKYLNWIMRYKIIEGIAQGLLYLHDVSRVRKIHRDLKASNILLDAEMNPKIANFGMARMVGLKETNKTDGTDGYKAPECVMLEQFSVKSDVFSFGVLVLEIVSGKKNSQRFENEDSVEYLLSHAWKNWNERTHSKFIDPTLLNGSSSMSDIPRCIHIGLLCVQEKAADRPTMASVVNFFNNSSLTPQIPTEPTFVSNYPKIQ